jgi:RNA polymerase sigma-70 factor (ECF subfamily)
LDLTKAFLTHRNLLFAFILSLVRDHHAAEDIFQEVGLAIIGEQDRGTRPDDFLAWARAICRHRIADHFRSRQRQERKAASFTDLAEVVERSFDEFAEETNDSAERISRLQSCLDALARRARQIIDARYHEHLAIPVIAERIGWRPNAVKVALAKARLALRRCVDRGAGQEVKP